MNKLNHIVATFMSVATIFAVTSGCSQKGDDVEVSDLRCRNLENPEGVDRASFSWEIETDLPNVAQNAWEIEIASTKKALEKGKADIWQSGKQTSDQQLNVEPQGAQLQPGVGYWWRVRVWTGEDKVTSWSDPAYFSLGPDSSQWKGQWITAEWEEGAPLPYFRKTFDVSKAGTKPARAVIYLSGLGCSDLFFNGQRVDSTRILDPAQTNYEQYALYSTFDVTPLLQKGNNCIGVMLGDGWYSQGKVWGPGFSYGKPILYAQMLLAVAFDNNANVCQSAILVNIDIRIGINLLRDFVQNVTQQCVIIGEVRRHKNRQILFFPTLYITAKNELIAQNAARSMDLLIQESFCFIFQYFVIIYACCAGAVLAQNLSLGICILFQIATSAATGTGGEHHHSHHTCQQQGYEFFQVLHKGIPPISVFCGYVSFFSKGFRNHRCLSALIISDRRRFCQSGISLNFPKQQSRMA